MNHRLKIFKKDYKDLLAMEGDFAARSERLKNRCQLLINLLKLFLETDGEELNENLRGEYRRLIRDVELLRGRLKPFRIAVTGLVSSGKSSFLNRLLSRTGTEMLAAGVGRITSVPCFLSYSSTYRVTATYFSISEITADLKEVAGTSIPDRKRDRYQGLFGKLKNLFSRFHTLVRPNINPDGVLEPHTNNLLSYVGRGDESYEFGQNLNKALELLSNLFSARSQVIRHVHFEGPFSNLPEGIWICDTPGLGDREVYNSERTRSLLDEMDECWQLTETSRCLGTEHEQCMTRDLISDRKTIRVIGTKYLSGLEKPDYEEVQQKFRSSLLQTRRGTEPDEMTEEEQAQWNLIKHEVEQQVNDIPLAFTELQNGTFGLDTCIKWLVDLGVQRSADLATIQNELNSLTDRVHKIGFGTLPPLSPVAVRDWESNVLHGCNQILHYLRDPNGFLNAAQQQAYFDLHDSEDWIGDQRSVPAVMLRGGSHVSAKGTVYDFTGDVVRKWRAMTINLRTSLVQMLNQTWSSLGNVANESPIHAAVQASLNSIAQQMLDSCFDRFLHGHVANLLQEHYRSYSGWYSVRARKTVYFFKEREITGTFGTLCQVVADWIAAFQFQVRDVANRLIAPISFDELHELRDKFCTQLACLDVEDSSIPEDDELVCPITQDRMVEPVSLDCGHSFERNAILTWFQTHRNCPVCRQSYNCPPNLRIRYDLIARIRFLPPREVLTENWWSTLWREIALEVLNQGASDAAAAARIPAANIETKDGEL